MEAFRSIIRGQLAPAGEKVVVSSASPLAEEPCFPGYSLTWVDSGTSALAVALLDIGRKKALVSRNEVIVPAYCCPDLIAAIHYAGLVPVLVDLAVNDPGYDIDDLSTALSEHTCAVIAVNFLGISDNLSSIKSLLDQASDVALIEDNAQWFPDAGEETQFVGDYVIFSFGRGKPVSLLGGGLLLHREPLATPIACSSETSIHQRCLTRIKYFAYNQLLAPFFYQWLSRNPLLRLGETHYTPLQSIAPMDDYRRPLVGRNVYQYRTRASSTGQFYDQAIAEINGLTALYSNRRRRLLRYPMLVKDNATQQRLLGKLKGLGVTTMYQRTVDEIVSTGPLRKAGACQNAVDFAARLLTLPVHTQVRLHHRTRIIDVLQKELDQD